MQYKDDQYAPSLHVEEFDDSLLYCGTTSLVPKTILPSAGVTEQVVTFNIYALKAAEKVAIGNADDVPAEQAVPGEPERKQTPI